MLIAYKIDRYLRSHHAMKRLRNLAHITSKKPDLTFVSKILGVYETLRSFVRFHRLSLHELWILCSLPHSVYAIRQGVSDDRLLDCMTLRGLMDSETLCGRVWCLTKWPISTRLVAVYPYEAMHRCALAVAVSGARA